MDFGPAVMQLVRHTTFQSATLGLHPAIHVPNYMDYSVLKQRMMEVMVTTGAISRAKLQSNHRHQQTNSQFLTGQSPSCRPTNSVKALKGKISHSMDLLTPSSPGGLPTLYTSAKCGDH